MKPPFQRRQGPLSRSLGGLALALAAGCAAANPASPANPAIPVDPATASSSTEPAAETPARQGSAKPTGSRMDALWRDTVRWFRTGELKPTQAPALAPSSSPVAAPVTAPVATPSPAPAGTKATGTAPSASSPVPAPDRSAAPSALPPATAAPAPAATLADRLNRTLDSAVGGVVDRAVPAASNAARQVGLDGPVVNKPSLLAPPDSALPNPKRMNLLQAWQAARANDPNLRAARASQASAQERLPQARAQLLPQVQLSSARFANDLSRNGLNSVNQPLRIFDRYDSANDTLSLRQPLVRAQQAVAVRQARSVMEEADAIFDREHQDFSVRLVQAYLEALLAADTVQLMESQRRFLTTAVEATQRALKAGTGTRTDVDAAQARLDLNAAQYLEARQQVDFARRQLQAYVNRPFEELAPLDEAQFGRLNLPQETLEEWVRRAEAESPEVRRLMAQRSNLSLEFEKARMGHLPTVDLVAQAQRSRSENTLSPSSQYENRSVGVQVNVPLYSGGLVNSVTRQAAADLDRIEEAVRGLRLDLGVRVHREYRSVTEGQSRIRALQQAVYSADVAVDSARKSVQAGVRTTVDVLNAEQQAMQARRDLAQARYGTLAALVRLQALVGQADETWVARINGLLQP